MYDYGLLLLLLRVVIYRETRYEVTTEALMNDGRLIIHLPRTQPWCNTSLQFATSHGMEVSSHV